MSEFMYLSILWKLIITTHNKLKKHGSELTNLIFQFWRNASVIATDIVFYILYKTHKDILLPCKDKNKFLPDENWRDSFINLSKLAGYELNE